jgi:hypothetical protein
MLDRRFSGRHVVCAAVSTAFVLLAFAPQRAEAHFVLDEPPAWMSQDSLGLPQKLGPCGDELDGTDAATPTGTVTAVQEGSTITVTIHEVIFHPGHYRIAVAQNRADLPAEPVVTAGSTACGSVPIDSAPALPVLADGVFLHTAPFTGPQTISLPLPAGLTCAKCTLQVIEFMSQHPLNNPGGCFYHHCADLTILPAGASDAAVSSVDAGHAGDAASTADAGAGARADGGANVADGSAPDGGSVSAAPASSASGCTIGRAGSVGGGILLLGATLLLGRRRRSRRGGGSVTR